MNLRISLIVGLAPFAIVGSAWGQQSNLLVRCLGKPLVEYGKIFDQPGIERVKSKFGPAQVSEFKTGSAAITAYQIGKLQTVTEIVAGFYQVPTQTWQEALVTLGLSAKGVKARQDKSVFYLSHVRGQRAGEWRWCMTTGHRRNIRILKLKFI